MANTVNQTRATASRREPSTAAPPRTRGSCTQRLPGTAARSSLIVMVNESRFTGSYRLEPRDCSMDDPQLMAKSAIPAPIATRQTLAARSRRSPGTSVSPASRIGPTACGRGGQSGDDGDRDPPGPAVVEPSCRRPAGHDPDEHHQAVHAGLVAVVQQGGRDREEQRDDHALELSAALPDRHHHHRRAGAERGRQPQRRLAGRQQLHRLQQQVVERWVGVVARRSPRCP